MDNGVDRSTGRPDASRRAWAKDALGAIALAEGAVSERVFLAFAGHFALPERNTFGEPVVVARGTSGQELVGRFDEAASAGKRATLIASAHDLAGSREALRAIAARRIGTVAHVLAERGAADAMALADLGWGMLFGASVEDALDLALVARRAAEDCGTPFFVVHERGSVRHVEAIASPLKELVEVFVNAPSARLRPLSDQAHPSHEQVSERAFAERVPFALGSAMRELESLTGRRRDVLERIPAGDAHVMMIALGELGESLVAAVERLRAQGQDVGAIKLTALRPFAGPRLVKAMARSLAITVLETSDEPLAQSGPLSREVKAAFADAITWAPGYPGIGRIPRIASGFVGGGHQLEASDLEAVVENMLADERGKRTFVLGGDAPLVVESAPRGSRPGAPSTRTSAHAISMRGRVRDAATAEACAEVCAVVVS
jgi:pyruvate ferredoxin oxidoreductase alpha subunit